MDQQLIEKVMKQVSDELGIGSRRNAGRGDKGRMLRLISD